MGVLGQMDQKSLFSKKGIQSVQGVQECDKVFKNGPSKIYEGKP